MKNVHEIEIKVEGKEWEDAITKSFNKNVQNVKVDGFRKGKVPRNIFEKKFGKESLYNDAIDFVLQEKYATVIKDSKLIPIIQPTIDIKEIDKAIYYCKENRNSCKNSTNIMGNKPRRL